MHHSTQNKDDEAVSLAGVSASSLVRRSGQPVILVFSQRPAALGALADASSLDEFPVSIGELAVKLVARFARPRMMLGPPQGGGKGDPSA